MSIVKLIKVAMRPTSHKVHFAENGAVGLELARALKPDLLVSDLAMPVMDGLQLCDAIRQDAELSDLKVVFLTASTQRNLIMEARTRSPLAIFTKPFSPAALRAELEAIVGNTG